MSNEKEVIIKPASPEPAQKETADKAKPPLPPSSLDAVESAEQELSRAIERIGDESLKAELQKLIAQEIEFSKTKRADQLTDPKDGLEASQKRTETQLKELLKKSGDEALKNEIIDKLNKLHQLRLGLLQQESEEEDENLKGRGYEAVRFRLGINHEGQPGPEGSATSLDGKPGKTGFLRDLIAKDTFRSADGSRYIKYIQTKPDTAGEIFSNDPLLTGAGIVAAGWKGAKISGHPAFALEAAEEAMRLGAENIVFSQETEQMLATINNERLYSNEERQRLNDGFDAIKNRVKAIAHAKIHKSSNTIFNKKAGVNERSPSLATVFNQMVPEEQGHRQFVSKLLPKQQAQLANDLTNEGRVFYFNGRNQSAVDYIRYLLSTPSHKSEFDKQLTSLKMDRLESEMNKLTTAKEIVDFITQQPELEVRTNLLTRVPVGLQPDVRKLFLNKLIQVHVNEGKQGHFLKAVPYVLRNTTKAFRDQMADEISRLRFEKEEDQNATTVQRLNYAVRKIKEEIAAINAIEAKEGNVPPQPAPGVGDDDEQELIRKKTKEDEEVEIEPFRPGNS